MPSAEQVGTSSPAAWWTIFYGEKVGRSRRWFEGIWLNLKGTGNPAHEKNSRKAPVGRQDHRPTADGNDLGNRMWYRYPCRPIGRPLGTRPYPCPGPVQIPSGKGRKKEPKVLGQRPVENFQCGIPGL